MVVASGATTRRLPRPGGACAPCRLRAATARRALLVSRPSQGQHPMSNCEDEVRSGPILGRWKARGSSQRPRPRLPRPRDRAGAPSRRLDHPGRRARRRRSRRCAVISSRASTASPSSADASTARRWHSATRSGSTTPASTSLATSTASRSRLPAEPASCATPPVRCCRRRWTIDAAAVAPVPRRRLRRRRLGRRRPGPSCARRRDRGDRGRDAALRCRGHGGHPERAHALGAGALAFARPLVRDHGEHARPRRAPVR